VRLDATLYELRVVVHADLSRDVEETGCLGSMSWPRQSSEAVDVLAGSSLTEHVLQAGMQLNITSRVLASWLDYCFTYRS